MATKRKLLRFLSIFLSCVMMLNAPMSVLAFEDVQIVDMAEEFETYAEEDISSDDTEMVFEDEITMEEEIVSEEILDAEEAEVETDTEETPVTEKTEESFQENSDEEELNLFGDESSDMGESIEILDIEEVETDTLDLAISFDVLPEEPEPVNITVTVSDAGNVVMARKEVTVTDYDNDGSFDVDDALYAAHEAAFTGGAASGYASEMTQYGLSLTKLWGKSGSLGYWLNDNPCISLEDKVKAGDYLNAFVYQDQSGWSDAYTRFESAEYGAALNTALTVALEKAAWSAETNAYVYSAADSAVLTAYDSNLAALAADAYTVPSLTVERLKNRCIPCVYWATGGRKKFCVYGK